MQAGTAPLEWGLQPRRAEVCDRRDPVRAGPGHPVSLKALGACSRPNRALRVKATTSTKLQSQGHGKEGDLRAQLRHHKFANLLKALRNSLFSLENLK